MPSFLRLLWRTAVRIVAALDAQRGRERIVRLPSDDWSLVQQKLQRLALVQERGWPAAVLALRESLHWRLHSLARELDRLRHETADRADDRLPSLADVYDELCALKDRFDQVEIDPRTTKVSVVTEPIELEDVFLGPFQLVWDWSRLAEWDALRVVPLQPNPANGQPDTTHPHVQNERLCVGEADEPLDRAVHSGRLCDYFEIVERVLMTYYISPQMGEHSHAARAVCVSHLAMIFVTDFLVH